MTQHPGSEGERGAVVGELATDQHQIDLAHQFVFQADGELGFAHLRQGTEMHLAGGADQRIEGADLLEQVANRRWVGDIRLLVTAAAADADDLVAFLEFLLDGLADGAAGADEDDFHRTGSCVREGMTGSV
ncbi:hypothetical protein D3C80_1788180 [compost metagenome]